MAAKKTFPYSLETFAENLEKIQPGYSSLRDLEFGPNFQEKILESLPQRNYFCNYYPIFPFVHTNQ